MYNVPRSFPEYIQKVPSFIEAAKKHARMQKRNEIFCPRVDYENKLAWEDSTVIKSHWLR